VDTSVKSKKKVNSYELGNAKQKGCGRMEKEVLMRRSAQGYEQ